MSPSIWTETELLEQIARYKDAVRLLASPNRSVSLGGKEYTRRDLDEIVRMLRYFEEELDRLRGGGGLRLCRGVV